MKEMSMKKILNLTTNIDNTTKENERLNNDIENTNKNYHDLLEKIALTEEEMNNVIFDTKQKLYTTVNTLTNLNDEKNILDKSLYRFEQENIQHNRVIEKKNMFYEDPTEKNEQTKKDAEERWSDVNKLVERAMLELDACEKNVRK